MMTPRFRHYEVDEKSKTKKPAPNKRGLYSAQGRGYVRDANGKQVRIYSPWFSDTNSRICRAKIADYERSDDYKAKVNAIRGIVPPELPKLQTNGEYLSQWFDAKFPKWGPTTRDVANSRFHGHVLTDTEFCSIPLRDLDLPHILRFIEGIRTSGREATENTKSDVLKLIRPAYNRAVRLRLITINPLSLLEPSERPKRSKSRVTCFSLNDERALIQYAETKATVFWRAFILVGLDAGLGPAEICGLRASDINWHTSTIHIQRNVVTVKGQGPIVVPPKVDSRERYVRISQTTLQALGNLLAVAKPPEPRHVFVTSDGTLWRGDTLRRAWGQMLADAGVPEYGMYTMRHTMASNALRGEMSKPLSIAGVSRRLGHAKIATTLQHYIHCLPNEADGGADLFAARRDHFLAAMEPAASAENGANYGASLAPA